MRKRLSALALCLALLLGGALGAAAQAPETTVTYEDLGNGITVVTTLTVTGGVGRSATDYNKVRSYSQNGVWAGTVTLHASFTYNGSSVSVTNAYTTRSLASGWSYGSESISRSGGTASVSAALRKGTAGYIPVSVVITCDKNGNVS